VLQALNARGLRQVNVVAADNYTPRTWQTLWSVHGWGLPRAVARWVANRLKQYISRIGIRGTDSIPSLATEVQAQGGRFVCVQDINGEACRQVLRTLHIDLMLLAGAPIVRAPILEIPRLGTLNAHQGALPRLRGMHVIEWAVLQGYPPTISVHFVDPGVDTGDIVATELVPLLPGDTLDDLRRRASVQQIDLLARTTSAALREPLPRRPQRPEEGQQYFTMHPRLRVVAEQRLQKRLSVFSQGKDQLRDGERTTTTTREAAYAILGDYLR
jgi:methionyl-tRNA formyltransferase